MDADDTGGDFKKTGAPSGQHDDAVISLCLALAFFRPGDEQEGRAVVQGVDRIPERVTPPQPKVEPQQPAAKPKTAAQLEAERMVRAL
ncbi:MAG: hypothetical protein IPK26_11025 [Planctomycetes bacterium]|nr:hypothetical protein [Planctomycetota bacterium]